MSTVKQGVELLLNQLPDNCPIEDIQHHLDVLYVLDKVRRGLEDTRLNLKAVTGRVAAVIHRCASFHKNETRRNDRRQISLRLALDLTRVNAPKSGAKRSPLTFRRNSDRPRLPVAPR
jgi:hypothetical protein